VSQRIIPYLAYRDAAGAIDFLIRAFGFEERFRYPMDDGRIGHAEVGYDDNVVMLASASEGFGKSPLDLPANHGQVYCFVDDVDAHYARAREGGATLCSEPGDAHGVRMYRAMDPEGHRWIFATKLGAS
jgi:uncharacterized glyoxalase superfamily protein PhnB